MSIDLAMALKLTTIRYAPDADIDPPVDSAKGDVHCRRFLVLDSAAELDVGFHSSGRRTAGGKTEPSCNNWVGQMVKCILG